MQKSKIMFLMCIALVIACVAGWAVSNLMRPPGANPADPGQVLAAGSSKPPSSGLAKASGQPEPIMGTQAVAAGSGSQGLQGAQAMPTPGAATSPLASPGGWGQAMPAPVTDNLPAIMSGPVSSPLPPMGQDGLQRPGVQGPSSIQAPMKAAAPSTGSGDQGGAPGREGLASAPGREGLAGGQLGADSGLHRDIQGVCLVPGIQDCEAEIEAIFATAATRILIQADTLPSNRLAQALVAAADRGVDVRLILDAGALERREAREAARQLADRGLLLVAQDQPNRQTNRLAIVDTSYILAGSYRLDARKLGNQALLTLRSVGAARDFEAYWIQQWKGAASIRKAGR